MISNQCDQIRQVFLMPLLRSRWGQFLEIPDVQFYERVFDHRLIDKLFLTRSQPASILTSRVTPKAHSSLKKLFLDKHPENLQDRFERPLFH